MPNRQMQIGAPEIDDRTTEQALSERDALSRSEDVKATNHLWKIIVLNVAWPASILLATFLVGAAVLSVGLWWWQHFLDAEDRAVVIALYQNLASLGFPISITPLLAFWFRNMRK